MDTSSNSSTSSDEAPVGIAIKKRKTKNYKCILEFDSYPAALKRLEEPLSDSQYIYRYSRNCLEGDKDYYFCQGQQKCPKCLYILRHSDSLKASIFICSRPHVHKDTKGGSLPLKSVNHIKKLYEEKPDTQTKS